ncbi:MAG: hypothetical protein NTZ44_01350 [Candidatus Nomurabacteria bacterium]|nr:hypothetical protein [Candidatus Nomurabacteria bacterium]
MKKFNLLIPGICLSVGAVALHLYVIGPFLDLYLPIHIIDLSVLVAGLAMIAVTLLRKKSSEEKPLLEKINTVNGITRLKVTKKTTFMKIKEALKVAGYKETVLPIFSTPEEAKEKIAFFAEEKKNRQVFNQHNLVITYLFYQLKNGKMEVAAVRFGRKKTIVNQFNLSKKIERTDSMHVRLLAN